MQIQSSEILSAPALIDNSALDEKYTGILKKCGIAYTTVGYHLKVGTIEQVQGWILHISVIRQEMISLLNVLVPFLISANVPFKIIRDRNILKHLLDGAFGLTQIGKVISIYPVGDEEALTLAKSLIGLTAPFKGPVIPTDRHLGAQVYTRYGGFSPILVSNEKGEEIKLIYDKHGNQVKDEYKIPFSLPKGIDWPFADIVSPYPPQPKKTLHNIYRPISHLKTDPKGNVLKALYLRRLWNVRWCVIKEGKNHMWCDRHGRDMSDRLRWQKDLHDQLYEYIPLPKALDLFTEDKKTYLAIEFIKGKSLIDHVRDLNRTGEIWYRWSLIHQLKVLDYAMKLIDILNVLHVRGYVHRDLTPVNFLVTKKDQLIAIDLELTFNLNNSGEEPPFDLGTVGYMSPQQEETSHPCFQDDIYGLGATLINLLTGISPMTFNTRHPWQFRENLNFFIKNESITTMLVTCLDKRPMQRPDLYTIQTILTEYRQHLKENQPVASKKIAPISKIDLNRLQEIVKMTIKGFVTPPTVLSNDLWLSPVSNNSIQGIQNQEFAIAGGFHQGLPGILYVLAKAAILGYDISACKESYNKAWEFIAADQLQEIASVAPGFYGGAAGIALSLEMGLKAGLVEDNVITRQFLVDCLDKRATSPELADGIAGQGIVALQCQNHIESGIFQQILTRYIESLLEKRNTKGYWIGNKAKYGKYKYVAGFASGNAGIVWYLLDYLTRTGDDNIKDIVIPALSGLLKKKSKIKKLLKNKGFWNLYSNAYTWDTITGILLTCIKTYETLGISEYRSQAEDLLSGLPDRPVSDMFSQEHGLSGLGEIYLEAYRVFRDERWQTRADHIANLLLHTCYEGPNNCYWLNNSSIYTLAGIMTGNGGILHFLLRYLHPDLVGYRLLK